MLKRLTVLAIAIAFAAGSAFADAKNGGIAREVAMGGGPADGNLVLNPFIFGDPSYMLINPAYQAQYKDYAWSNIGGGTTAGLTTGDNGYGKQNAGVSFGLSKEFSLGAVLSYDPSSINNPAYRNALNTFINGTGHRAPNPNGLAPVDVFEVVGAFGLGNLDLGFAVLYGWSNNDAKGTTGVAGQEAQISAHVFGVRGGLNMDLGGGSRFEASAALRLDKMTDLATTSATSGSSEFGLAATELQVVARLRLKVSNRVAFVPYGSFLSISGDPKEDQVPTGVTATTLSMTNTVTVLAVGAGAEYKVSNFLLAGGVSFNSNTTKSEQSAPSPAPTFTHTVTVTGFPVMNLGMEWWFVDWLAGRVGYYRSFQSTDTKDESSAPGSVADETIVFGGISNAPIGGYAGDGIVTLGVGLRFGNFGLDATVSEEALRRGLGLIGASDNINTFGYMTASFNFE